MIRAILVVFFLSITTLQATEWSWPVKWEDNQASLLKTSSYPWGYRPGGDWYKSGWVIATNGLFGESRLQVVLRPRKFLKSN